MARQHTCTGSYRENQSFQSKSAVNHIISRTHSEISGTFWTRRSTLSSTVSALMMILHFVTSRHRHSKDFCYSSEFRLGFDLKQAGRVQGQHLFLTSYNACCGLLCVTGTYSPEAQSYLQDLLSRGN